MLVCVEPCRCFSDFFLSIRPRTRLTTTYRILLGMVEARSVNVKNTHHTHAHGDEDNGNGNEDRTGEGGRETKKRKKPQKSCRHHVGNGGDLSGKRKKCRKERTVDQCSYQPE